MTVYTKTDENRKNEINRTKKKKFKMKTCFAALKSNSEKKSAACSYIFGKFNLVINLNNILT